MKLNTHNRTPKEKNGRMITILLGIGISMMYGIFLLCAFACIYYADAIVAGMFMVLLPIVLLLCIWIQISDMNKAYVEISKDKIHVVDYYMGVKIEKRFSVGEITSVEIVKGYSYKMRGYRLGVAGLSYIVFKDCNKRYLFKILYTPETKEIFEGYLQGGRNET